jgi:hypothetical protein
MNGIATLVRIPHPYREWHAVHAFAYEHVPSDLDISPDGRLLSATMSEVNGDQFLRVWELNKVLAGDLKPLSEYRFGQSVPESFVFSRDGRYLYGSSYFTGVSNIFRYEVATGAVEAVSNAGVRFLRRSAGRRAPGRAELHRRGFRSGGHRAAPDQGRQCDHVPRRRGRGQAPHRDHLAGPGTDRRGRNKADHRPRRLLSATQDVACEAIRCCRATTRWNRYRVNIEDR